MIIFACNTEYLKFSIYKRKNIRKQKEKEKMFLQRKNYKTILKPPQLEYNLIGYKYLRCANYKNTTFYNILS